jgi:hypothetical protein
VIDMMVRARVLLPALAATAGLLVGASTAMAASASISVTAANGASDPVAYIPRVFAITGTAPAGTNLYVKHRPAGGAPCAPTAYDDPGRLSTGFYGPAAGATFAVQRAWTWDAPGAWTFCIWLAPSETTISTPIAQTVMFRTPSGQIASRIRPGTPRVGQRAEVTVAGDSEAPRRIWVKIRPASGGPCAPTYDMDSGRSLIDGWDADGAFDARRYVTQTTPGQYVICDWLAGTSFDPLPVAGPSALTFNVAPAPPVVSSVATLDCRKRTAISRVRAGEVKSVCVRYRFAKPPAAGSRLSVSYVTPRRKTYKTVIATWPSKTVKTLTTAPLPGRAYKHRRGTWRATLRVGGTKIKSTSFKVI